MNRSDEDISLVFKNIRTNEDSTIVFIPSNERDSLNDFFVYGDDSPPVQKYIDIFTSENVEVSLYVGEEFKKLWAEPAGFFGDSVNSPFNHDSWLLEEGEFGSVDTKARITFTITDDDLK